MIGSAQSKTIQSLKSTKPQAGFDQDVTKLEELADAPAQDNDAREAPEAEPPQEDGRLPIEADLEAHIMDGWHAELREEREPLEATSIDDLYTVPTQMITDNSVLVTVVEEQRGHLPVR
eukprot:1662529-Pyramimonas_sp.AAC.1